LAEYVINNKAYSISKVSLFIANYDRKLRMRVNIRRKGKIKKITEFVERIERV